MKPLIYFLILAAMLSGAIYLTSQKIGLDNARGSSKIVPVSEWKDVIPGKWEFQTILADPHESSLLEGEVEYLPNGEFIRQVTFKYYEGSFHRNPPEGVVGLRVVAGGTVKGKWRVDTLSGTIIEVYTTCNMKNEIVEYGYDKDYNACYWYSPQSEAAYGNVTDTYSKSEVKEFSTNRILIKGKSFADAGTMTWSFKRLK